MVNKTIEAHDRPPIALPGLNKPLRRRSQTLDHLSQVHPGDAIALLSSLHSIICSFLRTNAMVPRLSRQLFSNITSDGSEIDFTSDSDTHEYSPRSSPTPAARASLRGAVASNSTHTKPTAMDVEQSGTILMQDEPTTPDVAQRDPLAGATRVDSPMDDHSGSDGDGESSPSPVRRPRTLVPHGILPKTAPYDMLHLPHEYVCELGRERAQQTISCQYIKTHDIYFLQVQFRIGGYVASAYKDSISPRGILRLWSPTSGTAEPWWVQLHTGPAVPRIVRREYAIGRVALMSKIFANAAIARELTLWAQKFHANPHGLPDADPALLLGEMDEDKEEVD
ncbi:hypothetical protein HMN09_01003000 [Mycena chlorophos]|uniref:Uncharacterized protein n=1 Tax=Mycena chlorophos TaxID=658473 RepID=A0A8H6SJS7_MYCCL|nr:hypothetical protein HMN09_01003000 [Mycena chlorophos]